MACTYAAIFRLETPELADELWLLVGELSERHCPEAAREEARIYHNATGSDEEEWQSYLEGVELRGAARRLRDLLD